MIATSNFKLLGLACVLMLLTLSIAVSELLETRQFIGKLSQSHQRMVDFRMTRTFLLDAETGQRGFLLTGQEAYLEPWRRSQTLLPGHLDALTASTGDTPSQATRAARLRSVALNQMEDLQRIIEVRSQSGPEAVLALLEKDGSKTQMDEARLLVEEALMEEKDNQSKMLERQLHGVRFTTSLVIASALLCLGAGVNTILLFRKALRATRLQRRTMIQRRRALSADRHKSRFVANMSHEIRTPMNAILGFSQLLREEVLSARATHYLDAIGAAGENLMCLINDVLDLSKIDAGHVELRPEVIDLRELFSSLELLLSQRASAKGLSFRTSVAEACPAWLWLDGLRLRQMMLNLLGNAIKFTSSGGVTLEVKCEQNTGDGQEVTLVICVKDTGRGINPADMEAVFKPFRQGRRRDESDQEGTGLGLTITRRLAQLMGGTIGVQSVPGKGSQFSLTLPGVKVQTAGPPNPDETDSTDWNELPPRRVLIVDDNTHNREVMGGFFRNTHHRVSFAKDGLEAVEAAIRDRPDLILMDIRMPRMNGIEATAVIRNNPNLAGTPVIAVTASSLTDTSFGIRQSFNGYLRKPFLRSQLFAAIRDAISIPGGVERLDAEGSPAPPEGRNHGDQAATDVVTDPAFLATLHALKQERWPVLTRTMAVRGVQAFARDLAAMAQAQACGPLKTYATALLTESTNYQIARMERTLAQFPALLDSLSAGTAVPGENCQESDRDTGSLKP